MSKEILKDEILKDEQLDEVTGGTFAESYSDAREFEKLGVKIFKDDIVGVPLLNHDAFVNLRNAFKQYGVTIKDDGSIFGDIVGTSKANEYFIGDKQVSRDEAWKHINAQFNK